MQQFPRLQPFAPLTCVQPTRLHVATSGLEKASASLRITQSAFVPSKTLFNTKTTRKRMTKARFQNRQIIILHALFLNQRSCFRKRRLENQSCRTDICAVLISVFLREFVFKKKTTESVWRVSMLEWSSVCSRYLQTVHSLVFLSFSSTVKCDIHSTESNIHFNGNTSFSVKN